MALPPLLELRGAQRDGTSQVERPRVELAVGAIGIDERGPAELIAFARRFASQLMWYDADNRPAGWWAAPETDALQGADGGNSLPGEPARGGPTFFDGIGPGSGGGQPELSYDEVAQFLANPAERADDRYCSLRRPHMALFLTAVRLMGHGQRVLNQLTERHLEYHLLDVLRLKPRPPEPDRAFVLFELGAGVRTAEAPAGLRLLAGRDSRHRDRIYRLDEPLIVNRARVARIASTFVDRQITSLAAARRSITATPEEQFLYLLALALGDPRPGDALPPFRGKPMTLALLGDIARFIGFARPYLFLELFELRAMLASKAKRAGEAGEWQRINRIIENAGRAKRGDAAWQLQTAKPSDLAGNLAIALGGPPDLAGLAEVETVDDLALHLDREDVRAVIKDKLFMDPARQFKPMMTLKRSIDADWSVVNGYLQLAGRNKRPAKPDWMLKVTDQAAFADNLAAAIGRVDYAEAGPISDGISNPDAYLARLQEVEGWFFLSAEDTMRLIATYGGSDATPAGARAWRDSYALLAEAHGRKVRAREAADLRAIRLRPGPGKDGLTSELEEALGEVPTDLAGRMEALARYVPAEDVEFARTVIAGGARRSSEDWDQVDAILAEARRVRLRLQEPVAQKEHWRALYAYEDARAALIGPDSRAWRCFGGIGTDHAPATIGWAIASPVLALSTGRRRIVLTLAFHADGGGALIAPSDDHGASARKLPFTVTLSGEKGWIETVETRFDEVDYKRIGGVAPVDADTPLMGLQVTLTLDETAPEVAPSPAASAFGETPWPVLRLMLRPVWNEVQGRYDTAYERFRGLRLARVHLAAAVGSYVSEGAPGLWPLAIETETGAANGKKPFEPFGARPSPGSELALGHRDLLHKRLKDIRLSFEWLGGPESLAAHYKHYEPRSFAAQVSLVDGGVRTTVVGEARSLFSGDDANKPVSFKLSIGDAARPDPVVKPLGDEVRGWRRYLIMRLTGTDFGHHEYSALATSKSIALANELRQGRSVDAATYTVKTPYTPKLKRIGLDFTAAHEIDVGLYDRSSAVDRLFHVHPFGVEEAETTGDPGWPLLPAYDEEGALYIGLADVEAPQSLALLFAGVEAGRAQDRTGPLRWSYLDRTGWQEFPEPPEDQTQGFTRRGIVRFALPPAHGSGRMPAGLYWLRATMSAGAANACDLIDVHAQAGSAHFVDDAAPAEHYLAPLPANTIRRFVDPAPGIARVVQPYATADGTPAEGDEAFRTRAAERLRHKGRALTLWDYERLVLERFALVHKVKCIPASVFDEEPGTVRLVIIPDIRGEAQGDPFAPRAAARLLDEIGAYLAPLAPPTASITVGHARFVQVRVRLGVRFRPGGDEAFDKRRLAEHLNRYLAPWAFDEGSDIAIGQRIDATSIVAFVDQLAFVDFVGTCRLFVSEDSGATFHLGDNGGESVEARGEDGVLTPAPRHEIDVITDDLFEQGEFTGVGYMKVELDFVVH